MKLRYPALAIAAWLATGVVPAEQADTRVEGLSAAEARHCMQLEDPDERLECFEAASTGVERRTFLERQWDLTGESKLFRPVQHNPNYILPLRWTGNANEEPFEGAVPEGKDPVKVQQTEAKFQISFKTKILEDTLGGPGDLWFGYTQQSHFQVYNGSESRPFRETNYEPELILAFPLRRTMGGWSWRVVGVGLVHQSNGRSEPISRSWNRIYGVVGAERENLSVQFRGWLRTDSTDVEDDDNPDVEEFIGRAEALVTWMPGDQVFTARLRSNLDSGPHRGSVQADWYFPLTGRVRGQLQLFSGYGESLIDFDHRQTAVGVGVLLFDPFRPR